MNTRTNLTSEMALMIFFFVISAISLAIALFCGNYYWWICVFLGFGGVAYTLYLDERNNGEDNTAS